MTMGSERPEAGVTPPNPRPFNLFKPSSTSNRPGRATTPGPRARRVRPRAGRGRTPVPGRGSRSRVRDRPRRARDSGSRARPRRPRGRARDGRPARSEGRRRSGRSRRKSGLNMGGSPRAVALPGIGAGKPLPPACRTLARQALSSCSTRKGPARRIAARRSHTARGVIDPRFSTGMPRSSAMRMAMPVPPTASPRSLHATTHRPADPALPPAGSRRSSHAASGRPANTAPTPDAGAPRSPCRPTAQPPTAPGSPGPRCPL